MEYEAKSDWHEQVEFSKFYFEYTNLCRLEQQKGDLVNWKLKLDTKLTFGLGVLGKTEKEEFFKKMEVIDKMFFEYYEFIKTNERKNKAFLPSHTKYNEFRQALLTIEVDFDSEVNQVMPFLNLKKKIDIGGM